MTREIERRKRDGAGFQYRKRYEVTCDMSKYNEGLSKYKFQYRKRYEVTCDRLRSQTRSICRPPFQYRKRYEVTCDFDVAERVVRSLFSFNTASGMRSHATERLSFLKENGCQFQYRKRYEVTCDAAPSLRRGTDFAFQYRKRYEVTCDSVSGRPQKQKAQITVLENLLETERMIALFQLSLHTPRVCNDPAKPYVARLAAIRGKSENLPRFFASGRFSDFYSTMLFHICQTRWPTRAAYFARSSAGICNTSIAFSTEKFMLCITLRMAVIVVSSTPCDTPCDNPCDNPSALASSARTSKARS